MRDYILPLALASLGLFLMFSYKKNSAPETPADIPVAQSTSWSSTAASKNLASTPTPLLPASPFSKASTALHTTPAFDQPYVYFQEEITRLNDCLNRQNCPYPNTDSRAYETAVYTEMVRTIKTLAGWQTRHNYQDDRIPELMSVFLRYDNPYVKIEALKVMSTQTALPNHLDDILNQVVNFSQPEPIPYAMRELQRYKRPDEIRKVDNAISKVLLNGGIYSAVEIAKNLAPLITPNNRPFYKGILLKLEDDPLNEDIYEALSSSLN